MSDDNFEHDIDPIEEFDEHGFDEPESLVNELVGDGKKYKTLEDLAAAKLEADRFIDQLIREKRQLEKRLKKSMDLGKFLEEIEKRRATPSNPDEMEDQHERDERAADKMNPTEETSERKNEPVDNLEEVVERVLEKRSLEARKQANLSMLLSEYKNAFGENAEAKLAEKMNDLGLDKDAFELLLAKSEAAVRKLFDVDSLNHTDNQTASPLGDTERSNVHNMMSDSVEMTLERAMREGAPKSFWDKLRRENRQKYLTRDIQAAITRSARKLGDAFWNN